MKGIGLLRPLTIAETPTTSGTGAENLLTPHPREIWVAPNLSDVVIDIDMGAAVEVDGFYLGSTNAGEAARWRIHKATGLGTGLTEIAAWSDIRLDDADGPRYSSWQRLAAPVTNRYFRIALDQTGANPMEVGIIGIGLFFDHAYAFGNGRTIIDTGSATPLIDGGFGINDGAIKAGFRWRFIDLGDAEQKLLWKLAKSRGVTRPLIVVEDLEIDPADDESLHYCLFERFEAYERAQPNETKWALSTSQWV